LTGVERSGREVNCSPPLAPSLRMSGAILLLPLYAFMVWTGKLLLYPYASHLVLLDRHSGNKPEFRGHNVDFGPGGWVF
jgi:hypothetical protein